MDGVGDTTNVVEDFQETIPTGNQENAREESTRQQRVIMNGCILQCPRVLGVNGPFSCRDVKGSIVSN